MKKLILVVIVLLLVTNLKSKEMKFGAFYSDGIFTKKWVALTFDDGPNPQALDKILEILNKEKIKATFFVLGSNIIRYPESAKKYLEYGHKVGNHTYSHLNYFQLKKKKTPEEIKKILIEELDRTEEILKETINIKPVFFRMPNGFISPVVKEVAKEKKYVIINWTFGCDWQKNTKDQLVKKYLKNIRPGAILLMHEKKLTAEALPEIIAGIKKDGYEIVPLEEILGI
ncbi:MAG: hypothetical protein A2539_08930 [Elusimicrobia bacterium RIFOXYD2_FULL_34_15]|nr:MAG: hypothetical protein A2539_08930 [Elusimicrobia bacterium RIFOXYD2_FULL_34_15]